jgi:hypothetical protein
MASISGDFATSLVSHYKFEESSGTREDIHGSNNLTETGGTINNAVAIQGDGVDFEASNTDYLFRTTPTGLTSLTSYSVSFWYKPESITTQGLVGNTTTNDGAIKFQFFLIGGKIYFRRNKTGGTLIDVISTTSLSAGSFYHVVGTFSTTNGMSLYVSNSSPNTSSDLTSTTSASRSLSIGARRRASSHDIYTDGVVDELSLWDGRELTSGNVTTIYNSGAGIPYAAPSAGGDNALAICNF